MILLVLTPTLGLSPFLKDTIASVAAAPIPARHVLVCPPLVMRTLSRAYPQLEIVADEGQGIYAALNCGLKVQGEWDMFTWINDDDVLIPQMIPAVVDLLISRGAQIGYGRVDYMDVLGGDLGPLPVSAEPDRLKGLFSAGIPGLTQQGTWILRAVVERLGGFDLRYRLAADFDFWARALACDVPFAHLPRLVARYRLSKGQLSGNLKRVESEIGDSTCRRLPVITPGKRKLIRWSFRAQHVGDLLRRYKRTGCWRSEALYHRARSAAEIEDAP